MTQDPLPKLAMTQDPLPKLEVFEVIAAVVGVIIIGWLLVRAVSGR